MTSDNAQPAPRSIRLGLAAQRHSATLSLIGLTIKEQGRLHEGHVVVPLHPHFIGAALEAADWS